MSKPPEKPAKPPTPRETRKARKKGRAFERSAFVESRRGVFDERALEEAMLRLAQAARPPTRAARALPTSNAQRWVPLGPSVVRRGQAEGRPRVTGRVRDLAVSADGTRAYAATAKGGVWYTSDGGTTWDPVGGWADRPSRAGSNAQACGCLLVTFGAAVAQDFVLVGTGELVPSILPSGASQAGGIGVLAGLGPMAAGVGAQPWEQDSGIAQLAGLGIYRLARHPSSTAASIAGPTTDRVVAATSSGLFLGTRSALAGPPARNGFTWASLPALSAFVAPALPGLPAATIPSGTITDVVWLPGGANGRIFVAISSAGVAFSDNLGANWTWVTGLSGLVAPQPTGRLSLASAGVARVYVLGEQVAGTANVWQIAAAGIAAPAAVNVPGVPPAIFGTQREYDQAIAVDTVGGNDRLYLGGAWAQPTPTGNFDASLWCLDTPVPPAAPALAPVPGLSSGGPPPAGGGADQPGLIGNNVHADVHTIRLAGPAGANRLVWVGCDGGVFISAQAGRCNSFLSRSTGLASLEVGYHAAHPTSSHFLAIGCQDNGTQVRVGDTVWEETMQGDGGGVAFHPLQSQFLVAQYICGTWLGRPNGPFRDPIHRAVGGRYEPAPPTPSDREWLASQFYSGPAAVRLSAAVGRIAVGTNRVWVTDDLGTAAANTWRVLPAPPGGAATDPRPGGTDVAAQQVVGVPPGLGSVVQLRWANGRELLALYGPQAPGTQAGVVRYTQNPVSGAWVTTVLIPGTPGAPNPALTTFTDIFPVPGGQDFYLTTTGEAALPALETCWFFDAAANTFTATNLRHVLDATSPPLGPVDPAYAVVVDPATPTDIYVGTVTGVWHGVRTPGVAAHAWTLFNNGLPQATVQDLGIWTDPTGAAGSPRLLRAGIQSRGLWEVDLAGNEARRTYVRVHERDDRRRFPTPMQNPRRNPSAPLEPTFASPDITVRPAANPAALPTWQLPAGQTINAGNVPPYQLWTFQTAFRWLYPSVVADGQWGDQLADLIDLHRTVVGLPAPPPPPPPAPAPGAVIDAALWSSVVATRLTAAGAVSALPADPLAVYRHPWQSAAALNVPATEVDLLELVVPSRIAGDVWQVFNEPSTVDVLIHHRDTRPLVPNDAFVVLLWRSAPTQAALLALSPAGLVAYAQSQIGGAAQPVPAGWNLVAPGRQGLAVGLDARLPRAVSLDVNLSGVTAGHRVLFLALVGSTSDGFSAPVVGTQTTIRDLVRGWPYAAMRLVRVGARPP